MTSSKRTTILAAVLLAALTYYMLATPTSPFYSVGKGIAKKFTPKLAGENSVELLDVQKQRDGTYKAKIKYYFTGEPERAFLTVAALRSGDENDTSSVSRILKPGHETLEVELGYPYRPIGKTAQDQSVATNMVVASLIESTRAKLAVASRPIEIVWPPSHVYYENRVLLGKSSQQLFEEAVAMIDDGSARELSGAKHRLELVLKDSARDSRAHIE